MGDGYKDQSGNITCDPILRSVRADDVFLHLKTDLPNKSAWRGPVSGIA